MDRMVNTTRIFINHYLDNFKFVKALKFGKIGKNRKNHENTRSERL